MAEEKHIIDIRSMVRKMSAFKKRYRDSDRLQRTIPHWNREACSADLRSGWHRSDGYRQKAPGDLDTDPWYGSDITFCQDGESLFRTEKHFCRIRSGGYFQAVCWQAYKKICNMRFTQQMKIINKNVVRGLTAQGITKLISKHPRTGSV